MVSLLSPTKVVLFLRSNDNGKSTFFSKRSALAIPTPVFTFLEPHQRPPLGYDSQFLIEGFYPSSFLKLPQHKMTIPAPSFFAPRFVLHETTFKLPQDACPRRPRKRSRQHHASSLPRRGRNDLPRRTQRPLHPLVRRHLPPPD